MPRPALFNWAPLAEEKVERALHETKLAYTICDQADEEWGVDLGDIADELSSALNHLGQARAMAHAARNGDE